MTNPLRELGRLGQSVWFDNIGRELLNSGELQRLIQEDGVTGVTSNPSIFEKAISSERSYDLDIHALVDTGLTVEQIYERLVIADVTEAADLLLPVYEASAGTDGFVSLEVSPELAYDAEATLADAERLFSLVARKNLLIKVPATPEGLQAVPELVARGINVNVTLIFSMDQYTATVDAYLQGLEMRAKSGHELRTVASVASFFVSRLDTVVDEILKDVVDPTVENLSRILLGKTAIANAKIAYSHYKEVFHGARFDHLREQGANPQKIVWASTSTKNSEYPDILYAEGLIGPETINTLPEVTLNAYRSRGNPAARLDEGLQQAHEIFRDLELIGLDMDDIMSNLLDAGVKAFAESYAQLLHGIRQKRTRLLRGWGHRSASLGDLQRPVDDSLQQFDKAGLSESLWSGDASLWTSDQAKFSSIVQRLGWLQAPDTMIGETGRLREFADQLRAEGFKLAVLLGMGGSSLATEVFITCFGAADGFLDFKVLDTTVPGSILEVDRNLDPATTVFIVSSKSGGTVEVVSLFEYFWARMTAALGDRAGKHFIAITDPGTSLGKLASDKGFLKKFLNPPDIGGRFSALSYFGLVPAALMGIDVDRLLMRASQAVEASLPAVPALENQGLWLGTCLSRAALQGRDKLTLIISPRVASLGLWLEQLVAESTGKQGTGIIPIDAEPAGEPAAYGDDRIFVYLRMDDEGAYDAPVSALEQAGHPVITLRLHTPFDLGREMFRWEFATAVAGVVLRINPFDEPNVTEAKELTKQVLAHYTQEGSLLDEEKLDIDDPALIPALTEFLASARPGDYAAFNAFLVPSARTRQVLQSVRAMVRDRYRIATTVGFGPRYLHSTGQIHKGGPDKGLFVQITVRDEEDAAIPGAPYSFGVLKAAQALGDYQALKNKGRRILRIHVPTEAEIPGLIEVFRSVTG